MTNWSIKCREWISQQKLLDFTVKCPDCNDICNAYTISRGCNRLHTSCKKLQIRRRDRIQK